MGRKKDDKCILSDKCNDKKDDCSMKRLRNECSSVQKLDSMIVSRRCQMFGIHSEETNIILGYT